MPSLADTQSWLRGEIAGPNSARPAPTLFGGRAPAARLVIYRRNYEASLRRALMAKFPATHWLLGDAIFARVAGDFASAHPPRKPSLAEYADDLPEFLGNHPAAAAVPYAASVALLDWHVGQVAVAADPPALPLSILASLPADSLPDLRLRLATGLRLLALSWPADDLLKLFLAESRPETLEFAPQSVWVEIRGSRGAFTIARQNAGTYRFRTMLAAHSSLGEAAQAAAADDPRFDPGAALGALFGDGVVVAVI